MRPRVGRGAGAYVFLVSRVAEIESKNSVVEMVCLEAEKRAVEERDAGFLAFEEAFLPGAVYGAISLRRNAAWVVADRSGRQFGLDEVRLRLGFRIRMFRGIILARFVAAWDWDDTTAVVHTGAGTRGSLILKRPSPLTSKS